jgi:hypothetical protein
MPTLDRKDSDAKKDATRTVESRVCLYAKLAHSALEETTISTLGFLTLDQPGSRRSGCHETVQSLSFDMSFSWVVQS